VLITLKHFAENVGIPELLAKLISGLKDSKFDKNECNLVRNEMEKCGWIKWTLSLFLVGGETSGAIKYVAQYPNSKIVWKAPSGSSYFVLKVQISVRFLDFDFE
jgi:hypothetical protein